jgi:hypothetical protein
MLENSALMARQFGILRFDNATASERNQHHARRIKRLLRGEENGPEF